LLCQTRLSRAIAVPGVLPCRGIGHADRGRACVSVQERPLREDHRLDARLDVPDELDEREALVAFPGAEAERPSLARAIRYGLTRRRCSARAARSFGWRLRRAPRSRGCLPGCRPRPTPRPARRRRRGRRP
jgi:hypothetical protein